MTCLFYGYGDHRVLHGLTHSFPTRRSSVLSVWGRSNVAWTTPCAVILAAHLNQIKTLVHLSFLVREPLTLSVGPIMMWVSSTRARPPAEPPPPGNGRCTTTTSSASTRRQRCSDRKSTRLNSCH